MRVVIKIFYGLVVLVLLVGIAATYLIHRFEQGEFQDAVTEAIALASGQETVIDGPYRIALGWRPGIAISGLHLRPGVDAYELDVGAVVARFALMPLVAGRLVVDQLEVNDVRVRVKGEAAEESDSVWSRLFSSGSLEALPALNDVRFRSLDISFPLSGRSEPVQVAVSELQVTGFKSDRPLFVSGQGEVQGNGFSFKAELGAMNRSASAEQPRSIELDLKLLDTRLAVRGSLGRKKWGDQLDLVVEGQSAEFSRLLYSVGVTTPALGELTAKARVVGDLATPRLHGLEMTLSNERGLAFSGQGQVANLLTGEGSHIAFSGSATDSELLDWAFGAVVPDIQRFNASGAVRYEQKIWRIEDFEARGGNAAGVEVALNGAAGLSPTGRLFRDLDLQLRYTAPDSAAARPLLGDDLPELGPVKGEGRYTAPSKDLAVEDVDIRFGPREGMVVKVRGRIGRMPLGPEPSSEIALDVAIDSETTKTVASALDLQLPELGPMRVEARFDGSKRRASIKNLSLKAGYAGQLTVTADGRLELRDLGAEEEFESVDLALTAKAPSTEMLTEIADVSIPDLGRLQAGGRLELKNRGESLVLKDLHIDIVKQDLMHLHASGQMNRLGDRPRFGLDTTLRAKHLAALGEALDLRLPEGAPVKVTGRLEGGVEAVGFKGRLSLGDTRARVAFDGRFDGARPGFKGRVQSARLNVSDFYPKGGTTVEESEPLAKTSGVAPPGLGKRVFSREALSFDRLHNFDLNLDVTVEEIIYENSDIAKASAHLNLDKGVLALTPLKIEYGAGTTELEAVVNAEARPPKVSVKINGNDLRLSPMMAADRESAELRGYLSVALDLQSEGESWAAMAANLDGEAGVALENGSILKTRLQLLAADLFGWSLTSLAAKQKRVTIECAMFQAKVDDGVLRSDLMVLDTPSITVKGKGRVNLVGQTIDMVLSPKADNKFWHSVQPVKIHGALAAPEVETTTTRSIARNYGGVLVMPQLFVSAEILGQLADLVDERDKQHTGCLKYKQPAGGE